MIHFEEIKSDLLKYLKSNFNDPFAAKDTTETYDPNIKFSRREPIDLEPEFPTPEDFYDYDVINALLSKYNNKLCMVRAKKELERFTNKTFVETVNYYISKKGIPDVELYKKANIDRRLFSKIMCDLEYKPAKDTALALTIALELPLSQAKDLLDRAGYTLSHSNKRDVIIEFFISKGIYDLSTINETIDILEEKIIGK